MKNPIHDQKDHTILNKNKSKLWTGNNFNYYKLWLQWHKYFCCPITRNIKYLQNYGFIGGFKFACGISKRWSISKRQCFGNKLYAGKVIFELLNYHFLKIEQLNNTFSNLFYTLYDQSHDIAGIHHWYEGNKE